MLKEYGITSVINYLRKSRQDEEREKKTGEDTLHEQKLLMDRVLIDYGIPYDQQREIGSGDKIATRPVFQQVIKELENDKYDAIAVKEISRLGRGSYTDMGVIYDLLVEKRIFIITPWKIYDPTNPADLRQIRFELFLSREEFETIRERLVGGRYNAAMEGKWVSGPAPFGFDYDPETKRLVINEEEAKIVRAIFDYYAYGVVLKNGKRKLVQFRALATYLRRIGIKTVRGKDEWCPAFLKKFLEHERYIGISKFNISEVLTNGKKVPRPENEHIIVEDAHPAIIDRKTWDRVQYRINNREMPTNTKLDFEPNRLAGLCICIECGKRFIRRGGTQRYTKKDGTVSVYEKFMLFCGTTGCTYVRYNAIEEDILATFNSLRDLEPDILESQLRHMVIADEPTESKDDIKKRITAKQKELNRRQAFIYEKFESGVYSDEMFLERKTEIDKELEELKELEKMNSDTTENVEDEKIPIDVDLVKNNLDSILTAYKQSNNQTDKNKLLHSVFSHINIKVLKKGRGTIPSVHQIEPFLKSTVLSKVL